MLQLQQFFKMMPKEKRLFRKSCHIDSFHWESLLVSRREENKQTQICMGAGSEETAEQILSHLALCRSSLFTASKTHTLQLLQLSCLCTTAAAEKNKRSHNRRVPTLSFTLITENLALTPSAEINAIAEASVAHSKLSVI